MPDAFAAPATALLEGENWSTRDLLVCS